MTGKDQPDWQRPTAVETAVFFNELLLLAVLALAGARLGGDVALRVVLAIALPAAAALWGRWLALRASGRLALPVRLAAKIALFAVASALLAVAGLPVWAAAFFVVSAALNATAGLSAHRGGGDRDPATHGSEASHD
jgi:Protein of unknown function (DUF2568)